MDDLYSDLPEDTTSTYIAKLENEIGDLKLRIQELENVIVVHEKNAEDFEKRLDNVQRENNTLRTNISSLFHTAKAEIDRKNKQIEEDRQKFERLRYKQYYSNRLEDVRKSETSESRSSLSERTGNRIVNNECGDRRLHRNDRSMQTSSRKEQKEKGLPAKRINEKIIEGEFTNRANCPGDKLPSTAVTRKKLKTSFFYSSRKKEKISNNESSDSKKHRSDRWPNVFEYEELEKKNSSARKNKVTNEEFANHKKQGGYKFLGPTSCEQSSIRKSGVTVYSKISVKHPVETKLENNKENSMKKETAGEKENRKVSKTRAEKERSNVKHSNDDSNTIESSSSLEDIRKKASELAKSKSASVLPIINHFKNRGIAASNESVATNSKQLNSTSSDRLDDQVTTGANFSNLETIKSEKKAMTLNLIPGENDESVVPVNVEAKNLDEVEEKKLLVSNFDPSKGEEETIIPNVNSVENAELETMISSDRHIKRKKIELCEMGAVNKALCTPMKFVNEELTKLSSFSNSISPLPETPERLTWSANLKISPVPLLNEDRRDDELNGDCKFTITGVDDVEHRTFRRRRKRIAQLSS